MKGPYTLRGFAHRSKYGLIETKYAVDGPTPTSTFCTNLQQATRMKDVLNMAWNAAIDSMSVDQSALASERPPDIASTAPADTTQRMPNARNPQR